MCPPNFLLEIVDRAPRRPLLALQWRPGLDGDSEIDTKSAQSPSLAGRSDKLELVLEIVTVNRAPSGPAMAERRDRHQGGTEPYTELPAVRVTGAGTSLDQYTKPESPLFYASNSGYPLTCSLAIKGH
jgi:hypothetical protein